MQCGRRDWRNKENKPNLKNTGIITAKWSRKQNRKKNCKRQSIVKNGNRSDRLIQTHAHGEGQQQAARGHSRLELAKKEVSMIQKMCIIFCGGRGSREGWEPIKHKTSKNITIFLNIFLYNSSKFLPNTESHFMAAIPHRKRNSPINQKETRMINWPYYYMART